MRSDKPTLADMPYESVGKFISLKAFNQHKPFREPGARLPKYQDILRNTPQLFDSGDLAQAKRIFVTHRWDGPDHPDPSGWQMNALVNLSNHYNYQAENMCFWYDYMSLPQKIRSSDDQRIFNQGLSNIRRIVGMCDNVSLVSSTGSDLDQDLNAMLERGWILFELYIARRHMKQPLPLFQRQKGDVNFGRMQYRDWDAIVPEISTVVPVDSREAIHQWFLRKNIKCTNGSDLAYLAALLHEELSRFDHALPPPAIEFDETVDLTDEEMRRYGFINGSHISHRFPNLFIENLDRVMLPDLSGRWVGRARYRPPIPTLDEWLEVSSDARRERMIDNGSGESPMYPGLRFEFRLTGSVLQMRAVLA